MGSTEDDEEEDDDESDSEDAKDISNYDFDYEDSSAAQDEDDDDILYYNGESGEPMFYNKKNEPVPVESVFDRRERLDVKKPGPFFCAQPSPTTPTTTLASTSRALRPAARRML